MTIPDQLLPAWAARANGSPPRLLGTLSSLGGRIVGRLRVAANYYAAAAAYEQLSKLSNAELRRRSLSRATLARDVCQAYDTAAER